MVKGVICSVMVAPFGVDPVGEDDVMRDSGTVLS
jgi:hypothetical protein